MLTLRLSSQAEVIQNYKKKIYINRLKKGLKTHLTSTTSIASGIINHCRLIRERLESYPPSNHRQGLGTQPCSNQWHGLGPQPAVTASSSFPNASNIPNKVTPSTNQASGTGYVLWCRHCCCTWIKSLTSAAHSLCNYIWKVIAYMVLTSKRRLGPDIWPETFE